MAMSKKQAAADQSLVERAVNMQVVVRTNAPPDAAPHERIVQAARDLFCRDGIHATGIDRILAQANASKMTLYARYGSKAALLREVLLREGADWRETFFAAMADAAPAPADRLPTLVAALGRLFHGGRFYGCAFMNAVAEHTKGEAWLRDLAADHHRLILAELGAYAAAAGHPEPAIMARQLLLLLDGTIAALMVTGDPAVLDIANRSLHAILRRD